MADQKRHPDPMPPFRTSFLVWTTDLDQGGMQRAAEAKWHWTVSGPRGFHSGCEVTPGDALVRAYAAYSLVRGNMEG